MLTKKARAKEVIFSLLKRNDGYAIAFDDGRILNAASGDSELVYADKAVIRHILNNLNKLKTQKLAGDVLLDTPCHSYCVLSNHIHHQLDKDRKEFWRDFVYQWIHWDRVYRTSPDPRTSSVQKTAYHPLYSFLRSRKIDPVDLPLNYAKSLEELKNSDYGMVDIKVSRAILRELTSLSCLRRTIVFYLRSIYGDLSLAVLLVAGHIKPNDYATAILAAEELLPGMEGISESSSRESRKKIITSVKEVLALTTR